MTFDNDFLCFYMDGVLENKAAKKFATHYLEGDSIMVWKIHGVKNNRYLNGCVDDIEFFDCILSPAEVSQLYNARTPIKQAE